MSDPEIRSESELQSKSWSTTTVYDAVYEKENTENEGVKDENAIEEDVYEEYDGEYQEYMPRYATYSINHSNKSESIIQKLLKKN